MNVDDPDLPEQQGAEETVVGNERNVWIREVDDTLKEWCQGDCVLGEYWFIQPPFRTPTVTNGNY